MIRAKIGNKDIYCCDSYLGDYDKDDLKNWASKGLLKCPACNKEFEYCHGKIISPYFRHKDKVECDLFGEPETDEHIAGKQILYNWISKQKGVSEVILEGYVPSTHQRPDIIFKYNNKTYVIEFQCSPISSEYKERHRLYQVAGIIDFWVLGTQKYNPKLCRKFLEQEIGVFLDINSSKLVMLPQYIKRQLKYGYADIKLNHLNIDLNNIVFSDRYLFNIENDLSSIILSDKNLYNKYSSIICSNNIVNWADDSIKILINKINNSSNQYGRCVKVVHGSNGMYFIYCIGSKNYYLFFNKNDVQISKPKSNYRGNYYWDCVGLIKYKNGIEKNKLTYSYIDELIIESIIKCNNLHEQDKEKLRLLKEEEKIEREQERLEEEKRKTELKKINEKFDSIYKSYNEYFEEWFSIQRNNIHECLFNNTNYSIFDSLNHLPQRLERKAIDLSQELSTSIDLRLKERAKNDVNIFVENKFPTDIYAEDKVIKLSSPCWSFDRFKNLSCQDKYIDNIYRIYKNSQSAFIYWERNKMLPDVKIYSTLTFNSWYDSFKCSKKRYYNFKAELFMNWNSRKIFMCVHDTEPNIFSNKTNGIGLNESYVMIPINNNSCKNELLTYFHQILRNTII